MTAKNIMLILKHLEMKCLEKEQMHFFLCVKVTDHTFVFQIQGDVFIDWVHYQ